MSKTQPIPGLSQESIDRIYHVSVDASDRLEEGMEPNEALAKSAQAYQLPEGHLPLAVRAFNVALIESQRKTAATLEEKNQDLPLADIEEIQKILYPTKQASVKVSRDQYHYNLNPVSPTKQAHRRIVNETVAQATVLVKQAFAASQQPALPEGEEALDLAQLFQMQKQAQHLKMEFRIKRSQAENKFITAYEAASKSLRQLRLNPESFRKCAQALFAASGDVLLTKLAEEAGPSAAKPQVVSIKHPWLQKLASAVDGFIRCQKATADFEAHEKVAERINQAVQEVLDLQTKKASTGSEIGKDIVSTIQKKLPDKSPEDEMYAALTDPLHERELRQARMTTMLNELMTDDPVISSFPAEDVLSGYNGISQTAPRVAENKEIVRSLMRKYLNQGALDPFEYKSLLDIELGLKNREKPKLV